MLSSIHQKDPSTFLSFFASSDGNILYSKIDELVQNQNFESNSSFEKINKRRIILVEVIYVTAGFELIIEVEKLNRAFIAKMKFDSWRIVLLYYSLGNGEWPVALRSDVFCHATSDRDHSSRQKNVTTDELPLVPRR